MSYTRLIQIEFNHCDPAGIVFYPRYFEMTNSVVENFFNDVVGRSFASMHLEGRQNGVPTAHIEADFLAPARLGDKILFALKITKIGNSSLTVTIEGQAEGSLRIRAHLTLVWVEDLRATPWPAPMRARLTTYQETQDA
jgi:4-hydroxybenzoyl-CoA thioesterase